MYYQISETGYPVISPIALEGFIKYDEANKPQELIDAEAVQAQVEVTEQAKQDKLKALDSITVTTTSGKVFDGRDKDQIRMLSAIQASTLLGLTSSQWKLANNVVVPVTLDELREAHALAIQAVGSIIVGGN